MVLRRVTILHAMLLSILVFMVSENFWLYNGSIALWYHYFMFVPLTFMMNGWVLPWICIFVYILKYILPLRCLYNFFFYLFFYKHDMAKNCPKVNIKRNQFLVMVKYHSSFIFFHFYVSDLWECLLLSFSFLLLFSIIFIHIYSCYYLIVFLYFYFQSWHFMTLFILFYNVLVSMDTFLQMNKDICFDFIVMWIINCLNPYFLVVGLIIYSYFCLPSICFTHF